jgi:hypothetical protein
LVTIDFLNVSKNSYTLKNRLSAALATREQLKTNFHVSPIILPIQWFDSFC